MIAANSVGFVMDLKFNSQLNRKMIGTNGCLDRLWV